MLHTKLYRSIEFLLLFLILPFSFLLEYNVWIKIIFAILGFAYVIWYLLKIEKLKFKISKTINWNYFWKTIAKRFSLVILFSIAYMLYQAKEDLFNVLINKPFLWIIILVIYSLTSVYPQELIYRTFFDKRYSSFFKSKTLYIFINALVFSFAHIIFWNPLVLFLTFVGGLFFAITYKKTQSTFLVSIEHAIYGCWLFTVGMGNMLGFPS